MKFYRPTDALTFYEVLTCIYDSQDDQNAFGDVAAADTSRFSAVPTSS